MDEKTDWQIENKKIWTEALAPEFDWSQVPLTVLSSVKDTAAYCRCMGHPDLKTVRKAVKKEILAKLNALLVEKGFQKDGTNIWRKGPDESAKRLSYARAKQSAGKPHLVTIEPKSGHGFLNSLKRMVGLSKHVKTQVFRPIGSFVESKAQSSVFLNFNPIGRDFVFSSMLAFVRKALIRPSLLHLR